MSRRARIAVVAVVAAFFVAGMSPVAKANHFISIRVEPGSGVWGTVFNIRGSTSAGTEVRIQRKYVGSSTWQHVRTMTSDGSGNFVAGDAPVAHADYRAFVVSDTSTSQWARALVRPGVHIAVDRTSGERALFTGRVLPGHAGTRVVLQVFDGVNRRWNFAARGTLNSRSAYAIAYKACENCRRLFRVAWPTQDTNHLWNLSAEAFVIWSS